MTIQKVDWDAERARVTKLLRAGNPYKEIAALYGVSTQAVSYAIKRFFPELRGETIGLAVVHDKKKARLAATRMRLHGRAHVSGLSALERRRSRLFVDKRKNAKSAGIEWNLVLGDIVWPERCPILGIPLDYMTKGRRENSPSFDRTDPAKGYIKGNVQVVSWRANRIKNDGTADEHAAIARYLRNLTKR